MATAVERTVRSRVLDAIKEQPLRPTELLLKLRPEFYGQEVEGALSELIDRGEVQFGKDRKLRIEQSR
jgi:hypothetical protein